MFADNNATSGGAVYVGPFCTADLSRVGALRNSAADNGGAFFVDYLGDLSLAQLTMDDNSALRNGGAMSAGTLARASIDQTTAKRNTAGQSGGMLHLSDVLDATLRGIDATDNKAARSGGAVAVFEHDSTRSIATLTNSSLHFKKAGEVDGEKARSGRFSTSSAKPTVSSVTPPGTAQPTLTGQKWLARGARALAMTEALDCLA